MDLRLAALRRFAIAITVLNVAGRAFLGFEQSLAQAFAALATAYSLEILLEAIEARLNHRSPRFKGASGRWLIFYCRVTSPVSQWPCFFMQTIRFFRSFCRHGCHWLQGDISRSDRKWQASLFNPSNLGIATTLFVFPWISIAPPYQFTENLGGIAHWILPCIFIFTGSLLNSRFTRRMPLIFAWVGALRCRPSFGTCF